MRFRTLILAFSIATLHTHAEIPAAAQKEIDQLVQQDKFTEALARVDALLKANPADKDLLDLKSQLRKSVRPGGGENSVPSASASPRVMSDEDRLEANTLNRLMTKIRESTDADEKKKLQEQILERSAPLVAKYPKEMKLWQIRAVVALVLDKPREGWEAGKNLKALGSLSSEDPAVGDLMAELNLKKWLVEDYSTIEKAQAHEAQQAERKLKTAIAGSWHRTDTHGTTTEEFAWTFSFNVNDDVTVGYEEVMDESDTPKWRLSKVATVPGTEKITSVQSPGYLGGQRNPGIKGEATGEVLLDKFVIATNGLGFHFEISGRKIAVPQNSDVGTPMDPIEYEVQQSKTFILDQEHNRIIQIGGDVSEISRKFVQEITSMSDYDLRSSVYKK